MWGVSASVARFAACQRTGPALARFFASKELLPVTDVRRAMILRVDDKYWEVTEWAAQKQGRGAASYNVTYIELETGKERVHKYGSAAKCTRIEPDRISTQVMYLTGSGKEEKTVVVADEEFNEIELPYSLFTSNPVLLEGHKVLIYKDGDAIVKVSVRT
ncbi:unnamed protein product [Polarella glacialis]|uniref:Translation elongation factor KOW-like domain-containing protein n=1 Tax=Polarella glacialis TaxID=89957 RepID=A0A813G2T7_POLGL|nr:unnamed protein product [Polarella glacialis]